MSDFERLRARDSGNEVRILWSEIAGSSPRGMIRRWLAGTR